MRCNMRDVELWQRFSVDDLSMLNELFAVDFNFVSNRETYTERILENPVLRV